MTATESTSYVQRKETNSAQTGEGRLHLSNEQPFQRGAAFQQAVAAGKPCGQEHAPFQAGADGLSFFPIQIPTKVFFPGVLLGFITSFNPSAMTGYIQRGR